MSYTRIEKLDEIKNKKVLFIDLETTGLVENVDRNEKLENRYSDYKENKNYDSSRIVQMGNLLVDIKMYKNI
jgi:hypothetical protein